MSWIGRVARHAGISETQAQAVLEAIYEPSDNMALAGELTTGLFDQFGNWDEDDCRLIWKSMIAEALASPELRLPLMHPSRAEPVVSRTARR